MQKLSDYLSAWLRPLAPTSTAPPPYKAYTKDFDQVVRGSELDKVLGPLSTVASADLDRAWTTFRTGLQEWQTRNAISALNASARIRSRVSDEHLKDTTVAFLVDQSGSMRGQRMLLAVGAVDAAQDFLCNLGVSVEILGFTTVSWKGGRSRSRWISRLRLPKEPGGSAICFT